MVVNEQPSGYEKVFVYPFVTVPVIVPGAVTDYPPNTHVPLFTVVTKVTGYEHEAVELPLKVNPKLLVKSVDLPG